MDIDSRDMSGTGYWEAYSRDRELLWKGWFIDHQPIGFFVVDVDEILWPNQPEFDDNPYWNVFFLDVGIL